MAKANDDTWKCPTCSLERFPYGEPCPTWATECLNMQKPNINGAIYKHRLHKEWQPLDMDELTAISIGIGAISDEDTSSPTRPMESKHDEQT